MDLLTISNYFVCMHGDSISAMNPALQILGAYALFVLIALTVLLGTVGCAMIAIALYEVSDWIRLHHRNIVGVSRFAKTVWHWH